MVSFWEFLLESKKILVEVNGGERRGVSAGWHQETPGVEAKLEVVQGAGGCEQRLQVAGVLSGGGVRGGGGPAEGGEGGHDSSFVAAVQQLMGCSRLLWGF